MIKNHEEPANSPLASAGKNLSQLERRRTLLYAAASLFSLIGLADSIYLTIQHVTGQSVRCTIVAGCSEVLSSSYATFGGIPLAMIGAAAYFCVFSLSTLAAFGYRSAGRLMTLVVVLMFVVTLWLFYLQAFVIRHFCQFCLLSAVTTVLLTGITVLLWRIGRRSV
jgi:uncharacterized membrane protein